MLILVPGNSELPLPEIVLINNVKHLNEKHIIFFGPEGFQVVATHSAWV